MIYIVQIISIDTSGSVIQIPPNIHGPDRADNILQINQAAPYRSHPTHMIHIVPITHKYVYIRDVHLSIQSWSPCKATYNSSDKRFGVAIESYSPNS